MNEIDVSKCEFITRYDDCNLYEDGCKYITDCYYKQLQQLKESNKTLNKMLLILNDRLEEYKRIYGEL